MQDVDQNGGTDNIRAIVMDDAKIRRKVVLLDCSAFVSVKSSLKLKRNNRRFEWTLSCDLYRRKVEVCASALPID
jgi:hypothetical protein